MMEQGQRYEVRADWLTVRRFLDRVVAKTDFYALVTVKGGTQWSLWDTEPYGFRDRDQGAPPLPPDDDDTQRYLALLRWTDCHDTPDTIALDLQVTGHEPFEIGRGLCHHLQSTIACLDVLSDRPETSVLQLRAVSQPSWFQGGPIWDIFTMRLPGFVQESWRDIQNSWVREVKPPAEAAPAEDAEQETQERGPTAETRRRAEMFRAIKDKHPDWSYARVAQDATRSARVRANANEKPPVYQADDVRNAYRAMGWPWERADQMR